MREREEKRILEAREDGQRSEKGGKKRPEDKDSMT